MGKAGDAVTLVEEASDVQNVIIECIDEGLKELGQSVRKVVYFHLQMNFGIKKKDIPFKPKAFSQALHSIFGQGANVIERLIVKRIQGKFGLSLNPNTGFVETVQSVMKSHKQQLNPEVDDV
jgi:hypothetical protein